MEEINNYENFSSTADQQLFENDNLSDDITRIGDLVKSGVLTSQQGQYCMSQLAKKTMERLVKEQKPDSFPTSNHPSALEIFSKENPDFFKVEGRNDIYDYLQNSSFVVDKDEIDKISQMVEKLEKSAIDRYLKQQAHEKILNDGNEAAKRKLTANAQNTASFNTTKNGVFTREQIGRMSGAEFTKNEPLIMEQLRKGLIK